MGKPVGSRVSWAAAGAASAAIAIGVGEILAAFLGGGSIVLAVGALVISLQPPGGKDLMVDLFGTNDKLALEIGTVIGGLFVGTLLGVLARRDQRLALAGFALFGLAAFILVTQDPLVSQSAAVVIVLAAVTAGVLMLGWFSAWLRPRQPAFEPGVAPLEPARPLRAVDRRSFLALAGTFVAVGGMLTFVGRFLGSQLGSGTATGGPPPGPLPSRPPLPRGAELGIAGLTPAVVPNGEFYRIDTRLDVPRVDSTRWNLRIHGMVDREVTLSYDDLRAMPQMEGYVTIACVSNQVGGHLVGNAKWRGVRVRTLLGQAGVQAGATQLVGRSFDGWTCGFPTAHLDGAGADSLLALEMNGERLPAAHGFPARLIVPGLYGYVSATKWITEIELTTLDAFDAYWVPLGWAKEAPILTQSRIDVPRQGTRVAAGGIEVAGVAWAPTRGVSRVEVELDESGMWTPAQLSVPLSTASWVQWRANVEAGAGQHTLRVRATDGTGETQTAERTRPAPDGARGWHTAQFVAT